MSLLLINTLEENDPVAQGVIHVLTAKTPQLPFFTPLK